MNKRSLNKYFEMNKSTNDLKNRYVEVDTNKYVISNAYSIVVFDELFDDLKEFEVERYNISLKDFYKNFTSNFELDTDITTDTFKKFDEFKDDKKKDIFKINSDYGVGMDLFSRVYNLIKFDKVELLKRDDFKSYTLIIRVENNKTHEVAYLLPCRVF